MARVPRARRHWYAVALWIHRWSGLIAAPFFLVLCATGSLLVFHQEIDRALGAAPRRPASTASRPIRPLAEVAATALRPGERLLWVYLDRDKADLVMVGVGPRGFATLEAAKIRFVDRATGGVVAAADPESSLTGFVSRLHTEWFAGLYGQLFGGIVALLVLACLASGLAIYAPHVRALAFGEVRRRRGARVLQRDLHDALGAILLGWLIVVCATGALLSLTTLLYDAYRTGDLRAMSASQGRAAPAVLVDVDRVVAAATAASPASVARYIVFPDTDFSSPGTYTVFLYGSRRIAERLFDVGIVDARDGHVDAIRHPPVALAALAIAQPLHFGTFGGLALKLVWLASAWAAMFVTANGAWLWWHRWTLGRAAGRI